MSLDDNISNLATAIGAKIKSKQDILVSSENLKTINGESLLGAGNIIVSGNGEQTVFIQSTQPEINVGSSALWIQKNIDGSITFNLCEN